MGKSAEDWHLRFEQQAEWTGQARGYLLRKIRRRWRARILEAGCGTGAITRRLHRETRGRVYGLDINSAFLALAKKIDPDTRFTAGDAASLPYASCMFDAVVCHFFLLWIAKPAKVLEEMARVTRPGGLVMAFAEPDYGGRIDAPPELEALGRHQADSLRRQGAATNRGRELAQLFCAAGLEAVETGVLGGQWRKRSGGDQEIEAEWLLLEDDLAGSLPRAELRRLKEVNARAWEEGNRVLYVPTFYAVGEVHG